jgi:tetratricopeptide (TPR) repeat protein
MAAYVPSEGREDGDAAAALAICEEGATRLPRSVEPRKCAAELARITDRAPLAARWVKEALALAPDDRDLAEIQARLYVAEVADLVGTERLQAAARVVDEAERFYAGAAKVFAAKPIETSLADLYLVYGRGLYTQGEVQRGVQALERSRALEKQPEVTEELAQIALKTGKYRDALRGFEEAAAAPRPTPIETTFDGNRLRRLAGDAAAAAGDKQRAETLWTKALASWSESLGASLPPRARAQAMSEIGRLYYGLGNTERAMEAFNHSVDLDPEQTGVYGDVIAFLATRGHYAEALDAYHRALGRAEVSEYLKAYTSFWLMDLARLRGVAVDPSTTEFLGSIARGDKWYHLIARFKLGQMSWNDLVARADTRGKRAEAYFYEGMARYIAGDRARAEKLMSEVLATQMLGFFEYDMASYYLRHGPPRAEVAKKDR